MYSTSAVNYGNFRVLSDSIVAAFMNPRASLDPIQEGELVLAPVDMVTTVDAVAERPVVVPLRLPDDTTTGRGDGDAQLDEVASALTDSMQDLVEEGLVNVRREADWVEIEIRDSLLFPSGSRVLLNKAVPLVERLGESLRGRPNEISVEGFTDNQPIRNGLFPSNWELSAARASAIVRALEREGVAPAQLSATGYGEHRPVADNATEEGRAKNRRVVLVVRKAADLRPPTLGIGAGVAVPARSADDG
jgi:chemotaxis protein MotB